MKTTFSLLTLITAVSVGTGWSQPVISSVTLDGQAATVWDSFHPYAAFSVSPGADVAFTVHASGTPPLHYRWQFNHADLPAQTNSTLAFPNVQSAQAGDYTVVVSNAAGSVSRVAPLTVDPTFSKITTDPVVNDTAWSQGGTWGDYTGDGFLDLFVCNGLYGYATNAALYRNNGNGTFTKITAGPPVNLVIPANSACWGDYENTGNLDLFVSTSAQNLLYHNNGDATFTQILTGSMVTSTTNSLGAAWCDYDQDGFLDLFVTIFDPTASSHNFLYRNNGDGTFTQVNNSALVTDQGSSLGCAWADFDGDGYIDLFVCGGAGPGSPLAANRLYHNNGDGTFRRITTSSIATDLGYSGNAAWGDYDGDGLPDLFVANGFGLTNFLYRNIGNGTFTRITKGIIPNDFGQNSYGCAWGDYDNDGFLDLFVTHEGYTNVVPIVVNALYHNNGDGTFTKVTTGSPVNEYSESYGCAWVDYDNDGFLDLFATRGDGRGNYLYRNNGNSNGWLTVKLIGKVSNRSAIGATVRVKSFYRGASRWQWRQITGGSGWAGHNELRANFGLGDATNVDEVRIEWPSGIVQTLTNVAPKQFLTVEEHQEYGGPQPELAPLLSMPGNRMNLFITEPAAGARYALQASSDLATWTKLLARTSTNGVVPVTDPGKAKYPARFYRLVVP